MLNKYKFNNQFHCLVCTRFDILKEIFVTELDFFPNLYRYRLYISQIKTFAFFHDKKFKGKNHG